MRRALEDARASHAAGAWDEALRCYELALEHLPGSGTAEDVADILRWVGSVRTERGELDLAGEMFEASLVIAEINGLKEGVASALICLAVLDQQRGRVAPAEQGYQRAVRIAVEAGNPRLAAMAEQNLGTLANIRGEHAAALECYQSALERSRALGDDVTAAHALNNLARTHAACSAWESAGERLAEAREHALRAGETLMVGSIGLNRAELYLNQRAYGEAEAACREALEVFARLRSKRWMGEAYKFLGVLHRERGDAMSSSASFSIALGLAEVSENCLLQAETQLEWSVIHLQHGRAREGIRYLNGALQQFGLMRASPEVLDLRERIERAEGLYLSAVQRWATDLLGASAGQVEHALRVAELSCSLARKLELSGWELLVIRVGALLHDVGKTVIGGDPEREPQGVPPRLSRAHPITGDAILAQLDFPWEIRSVVRHHHEELEGQGYPDGLAGGQIPLSARIVAVANAFDHGAHAPAATRHRPQEILARLHGLAGRSYDPAVLQALTELVRTPAPGSPAHAA